MRFTRAITCGLMIVTAFVFLQAVAYGQSVIIKDLNGTIPKADIPKLTAIINEEAKFHANHLPIVGTIEIPVRMYNSLGEFKHYQHKIFKSAKWNYGFYSNSTKECVINKHKGYFGTIIHEAQHFLLRSRFRNPPKWINEGLSEVYETAYQQNNRFYVRKQRQKTRRLLQWLREDKLPDLYQFFSLSNNDWEKQDKKPDYRSRTISWGLVYFLMSTKVKKKMLSRVIWRLSGDSTWRSNFVLNLTYEGGLEAMEKDFIKFLKAMPSGYAL